MSSHGAVSIFIRFRPRWPLKVWFHGGVERWKGCLQIKPNKNSSQQQRCVQALVITWIHALLSHTGGNFLELRSFFVFFPPLSLSAKVIGMLVPNLCDQNISIFKEKLAWLHCQLNFSLVETGQSKTFLGKYVISYVYQTAACLFFYRHFNLCRLICGLSWFFKLCSSRTITFSIRLPTFVSYRYIMLSTLLGDFLSTPKTSWWKSLDLMAKYEDTDLALAVVTWQLIGS